jgi:hypothetical protein
MKASVGGAEFQRQQTAKLLPSQGTKIVIETFESPQTCTVYLVNGMYHIHCYIVVGKVSGSSTFRSTRHSHIDPFCLSLDVFASGELGVHIEPSSTGRACHILGLIYKECQKQFSKL